MGRKTKLGTQYMFAGIFVMLFVSMFFTKDYIMSVPEQADAGDVSLETVEDGTYTGTGEGFGGTLTVEVTVADGEITDVEVTDHSESQDDIDEVSVALEEVPANIAELNSLEVDVISGASLTSNAIMQAVANALSGEEPEASDNEDADDETEKEEPAIDLDAIEEENITYEDGTYTGSAEGFGDDDLEVEVTVEDGKISEVLITESSETEQVVADAFEFLPQAIVKRNSPDVDIVSGATVTSEALIEAVTNALEDAQ